ncbi:MAG: hypothetical protein ACK56I_10425, partial [bacterium]
SHLVGSRGSAAAVHQKHVLAGDLVTHGQILDPLQLVKHQRVHGLQALRLHSALGARAEVFRLLVVLGPSCVAQQRQAKSSHQPDLGHHSDHVLPVVVRVRNNAALRRHVRKERHAHGSHSTTPQRPEEFGQTL